MSSQYNTWNESSWTLGKNDIDRQRMEMIDKKPMNEDLLKALSRDDVLNNKLYSFDNKNEFKSGNNENKDILDSFKNLCVDKEVSSIGLNLLIMSKKWAPNLKMNTELSSISNILTCSCSKKDLLFINCIVLI